MTISPFRQELNLSNNTQENEPILDQMNEKPDSTKKIQNIRKSLDRASENSSKKQ